MGSMGGVAEGALASHLCGPWFDSRTEWFVGSLPCFRGFSPGSLVFPPSAKNQHFLIPTWTPVDEEPLCGNATANCYLLLYLFI
jgi:hypothetical protein